MRRRSRKALVLVAGLGLAAPAWAADGTDAARLDALTKDVETLKQEVKKTQEKALDRWLELGGDYRFRVDSLDARVAAHAPAMTFADNMAQDLVSRQSAGEVARFFMIKDPAARMAKLFEYFPGALAQNLSTPMDAFGGFTMIQALGGMTAPQVAGALQQTALTRQQAAIMGSLMTPSLFNAAVAALSPADQAALGALMADPQKAQLLQQMIIKGMLGGGEGSYSQVQEDKKVRNATLYTNRFGLNLKAKAAKDVTVHARFLMYKTFGSLDDDAVTAGYFADRVGVFDGTLGHVPSSDYLNVDRAYVTWSNMFGLPAWFSVGRRPSTGGSPSQVRQYGEPPGTGGVPSLLVDYAFDGMTLGVAPDLETLPGFYAKVCYGRGFESGYKVSGETDLKDTDMIGVALVAVDTAPLRFDLQWNRGTNIFDFPVMKGTIFGDTGPSTNLGDIDWYGANALGEARNLGLTWFLSGGMSITHPNDNVSANAGNQGLLTGAFFAPEEPEDKTGWALYVGLRKDFKSTGTSIGGEYNHGSKNWITFAPAADDMWTAKLGTRGNVYEAYLIQNLNLAPVSSYFSKAFVRLGYQYYDFDYTGSNNWVGSPQKISDLEDTDLALLAPVEKAQNLYATFEVKF